jgi:thymidylate kinase
MAADQPAPERRIGSSTQSVAALVDRAAAGRVVIVGSLPPGARDLDLLVRPSEEAAIARALRGAGFVVEGESWARFAECSATEVELLPARGWGLPAAELESLFAESVALPGFERLAAPAPHHRVLIGATRLVGRSGHLAPRHRERILATTSEHPGAWALAQARAAEWEAADGLVRLSRALAAEPPPLRGRMPAALRRVRATLRPQVIALSGIDGSGKSLQARALAESLGRLGRPAGVVWTPLANEAWLDRLARPVKRVLSLAPGLRPPAVVVDPGRREMTSNPGRILRHRSRTLTSVWATLVAVANAWSLGRSVLAHAWAGRVVVADRYHLDSAVRMRFLYDESRRFGLVRRISGALSPRPRLSFFLEVEPATSLARKDDGWSQAELAVQARLYREEHERFGADRLDGSRPPDELCSHIAERVWRTLR